MLQSTIDSLRPLRERRWLRDSDLRTLEERLNEGKTHVPHPRRPIVQPVEWAHLAEVLGSYNAWVRLSNLHERDRELPLSPDWWDGTYSSDGKHHLWLSTGGKLLSVQAKASWWVFYPAWDFRRNELPLSEVKWAGWQGGARHIDG